MDLNQVISKIAHLQINPLPPAFLSELRSIVDEADRLRHGIPQDEKTVTQEIAKPYCVGGLLVLLMQPRLDHPWQDGMSAVVADCPTLDALNEAVSTCGFDGLGRDVSVLDLWALLPPSETMRLTKAQLQGIESRVMAAIEAKRPDCILCMGKVRKFGRFVESHGC